MPTVSGFVYDSAGNLVSGRTVRAYRRDTGALLMDGVSSDGAYVAADPQWANTTLLRGEGANGGATFVDESASKLVFTASGAATTSTAQVLFGTSSMAFPDATATLSRAAFSGLQFGTGDWAVETFVYLMSASVGNDTAIISHEDTSSGGSDGRWTLRLGTDRKLGFQIAGSLTLISSATVPLNTWVHLAVAKASGSIRLFIAGVLAGANTNSTNFVSTNLFRVGKGVSCAGYTPHYQRSLRITKGNARGYTTNFTPPAVDFLGAGNALSLGQYSLDTNGYAGEVNVVCLDDAAGATENDLILRTTPA